MIRLDYTRHGAWIVGECRELEITTDRHLDRGACEEALTRAVLRRLHAHPDDVCFLHAATVEAPAA